MDVQKIGSRQIAQVLLLGEHAQCIGGRVRNVLKLHTQHQSPSTNIFNQIRKTVAKLLQLARQIAARFQGAPPQLLTLGNLSGLERQITSSVIFGKGGTVFERKFIHKALPLDEQGPNLGQASAQYFAEPD